ncbi:Histidine kinase-, DNA gyrase B-, and HSP90-like ATPase [Anoxynatronum buryatiense]|uniref:histidine kinase n=2 Tax=Anoxynatronum buryatiense TaxID=489973 RepID=A0AA45WTF8_9CLOT|nr:Histidine kinase-, DNA gyrase B-, and HSP90-like ATPase [Anoxynatronum buryatiense]
MLINSHSYIWLFFFYGLAFFTLGTSSLQQKLRHSSEFPLMRCIHLLGFFGVLHGISEWIIMLRVMGVYQEIDSGLYLVETFVNGASYAFLLSFAIALLVRERLKYLNLHIWIPAMIFTLWCFFYLGRYYGAPVQVYRHITLFNHLTRYFMGFPGALLSGVAYYLSGRQLRLLKLPVYARLYSVAGVLFIVYGITAGLLTPQMTGSYQNVTAVETIIMTSRLPIELLRAGSAIGITILTIRLFDSFCWEMQERLNEYAQRQLLLQERKKTTRMVHDQIIQRLFGAGIYIENMLGKEPATYEEGLLVLKDELNATIGEARAFLKSFSESSLVMEDFQENLQHLVDRFRMQSQAKLDFEYHVPPMVLGKLSAEKNAQLYYIVQEALLNIQKHAQASHVRLTATSNLEELVIRIEDNGIGISLTSDSFQGFGIRSMKERAEKMNATIHFERRQSHTYVTIMVPWEER